MELSLLNVTKTYADVNVVDHLSIHLQPGIIGLLGENGAGKTTLIRMLTALMKPSAGKICFDGKDIFKMDGDYRKVLGYLPQDFGYYPDMNPLDYLGYIASVKAIRPALAKRRIKDLLQVVSLWEVRKKKIKKFSGGMIQRLGIAQALLNDPKVLILDEPTAGLDPEERYRFRQLLCSLASDKIILLSTHIVSDVESIADQILLLHKGKLLDSGTVEELIQGMPICAWKIKVSRYQADSIKQKGIVTSSTQSHEYENIRILCKESPIPGATQDACTLEDVFLFYNRKKENVHVVL